MAGTGFAETTPYGNLECGRAKSGRRDLMGSQRVKGQVCKEAWKPQVGRTELRNTKASPREGEETAENPLPPIQCATHPIGHPQGGLLSITLYVSNAGNASAAIFWWFLASAVVLRKGSPASAGASAGIRACVGRYVNQNCCFSGHRLATKSQGLVTIHPDLNFLLAISSGKLYASKHGAF